MTFYSVFVNLREKCALDCCTITNLNAIIHNSRIAWWIVECFYHSKDVGSSPVAFKYFLFHFLFDLLVSLSLFLILCTTGYIYLNLACVNVTNTAP